MRFKGRCGRMSQAVDNLLKGCGKKIKIDYRGQCPWCNKKKLCALCKSKAQGMIEILEDELEFLNKILKTTTFWETLTITGANNKIEEIKSDLNKLKEMLK